MICGVVSLHITLIENLRGLILAVSTIHDFGAGILVIHGITVAVIHDL